MYSLKARTTFRMVKKLFHLHSNPAAKRSILKIKILILGLYSRCEGKWGKVKICIKEVNLHVKKETFFRWLKVLDDVELWELTKKKTTNKTVGGGGRSNEQRSLIRAVIKRASVSLF